MKRIRTQYPHLLDAEGKFRKEHCLGYLEIIVAPAPVGVYVLCSVCGEGYRFSLEKRAVQPERKGATR